MRGQKRKPTSEEQTQGKLLIKKTELEWHLSKLSPWLTLVSECP